MRGVVPTPGRKGLPWWAGASRQAVQELFEGLLWAPPVSRISQTQSSLCSHSLRAPRSTGSELGPPAGVQLRIQVPSLERVMPRACVRLS